ncbi:hypothetical protein GCM10010392_50500 [Streptomyces clavifer]|nr:hypothetical protein GCM10010392_50500 [Streptomyces clavifer]
MLVERRLLGGDQHHARGQAGQGGAEFVVAHPLSMGDGFGAWGGGSLSQHNGHASAGRRVPASGRGTSPVLGLADQGPGDGVREDLRTEKNAGPQGQLWPLYQLL